MIRTIVKWATGSSSKVPAELPVAEWVRAFQEIFGGIPDAKQMEQLDWLSQSGDIGTLARYRRIITAFDQQNLHTSVSVRWGPHDVELRRVAGISMYLDAADVSVAQAIAAGSYEPHLIGFFNAFLREGMSVVDAGANIGLYTLLSAARVGPRGKVWSFEPNSENCRLVLASAAENGFANIELFPLALGNARGAAFFTSALGSNGGIQERAKNNVLDSSCKVIPVARLDDFAIGQMDFIKMDVEGAEALLVQGAVRTLDACRPVVVSEFSDEMLTRISGWNGARFLQFFAERQFFCYELDKATHKLVPIEDPVSFANGFVGNGRIADLAFCPREKQPSLPAEFVS